MNDRLRDLSPDEARRRAAYARSDADWMFVHSMPLAICSLLAGPVLLQRVALAGALLLIIKAVHYQARARRYLAIQSKETHHAEEDRHSR